MGDLHGDTRTFESVWQTDSRFECEIPDKHAPCARAEEFQDYVDRLFEGRLDNADQVVLNQMKVEVQDRYYDYRSSAPRRHQNISGIGSGHRCIFAVFIDACKCLREKERAILPQPVERIVTVEVPAKLPASPFDGLLVGTVGPDPEFDSSPD